MHFSGATSQLPPLWGLVLAGGRGSRLGGRDKGTLEFHGMPQARWAAQLLEALCGPRVFVSVREDQAGEAAYRDLRLIIDREPDQGPAEGLLAAAEQAPPAAWLVVAADLPLIDLALLETLSSHRSPSDAAVAYRHADGTLEPLCAIYEPAIQSQLGGRGANLSLRRALAGAHTRVLVPKDPWRLQSVNTAADERAVRARLSRT